MSTQLSLVDNDTEVITAEVITGYEVVIAVEATLLEDEDGKYAEVEVYQDDEPTESRTVGYHPTQQDIYTIACDIAARRPVRGFERGYDTEAAAA